MKFPTLNSIKKAIPVYGNLINQNDILQKKIDKINQELAVRPPIEYLNYYTRGANIQFPRMPLRYLDLYDMYRACGILRTAIDKLKKEIFRRGYEWKPKFAAKCTSCGKEYDNRDSDGLCDECGGKLRPPKNNEFDEAEAFFNNINENGQGLLDVMAQFEDDLNIVDDAYLLIRKSYVQDEEGNIITAIPREIVRVSPCLIRIVGDHKGNLGGKYWVCLRHRNQVLEEPGKCPECGLKMHEVHYVALEWETRKGNIEEYYVKGEVIHASKHSPSLLYGYSPIITFWKMCFTLVRQEQWIMEWYMKYRRPKQFLMAVTNNQESLMAAWDKIQKKIQADPHYTPLIPIESESGRGDMKVVDLGDTIAEMQYIETRKEFRERISGFYGVTPVFMADVSNAGGLNNEGLQITVTNRAVEDGQSTYHNKVFPQLEELFGIQDWKIELLPSEEKDEMADLQRESQKIINAQGMSTLGFNVILNEDNEFDYEKVREVGETPPSEMETQTMPTNTQEPISQVSGLPESLKEKEMQKTEELGEEMVKEFWNKAQEAILSSLWKDFKGINKSTEEKVKSLLKAYLSGGATASPKFIVKRLEKLGVDKNKAETILRTEENVIANKARELAFKEREEERGEEFKYKWSVAHDNRLSDICKNIEIKVSSVGKSKGVTLDVMKGIIRDVVKKETGKYPVGDFRTHPNCRSTLCRII